MKESNIKIILMMIIIGVLLIAIGIILQIREISYCNSLEVREYIENRERCKNIVER